MKELWAIYLAFFKIGALSFGGGYAMLPIIQRQVVQQKGWATNEDVLNFYAVGQCLPGIIAVNTALFIGHKQRGKLGAIAAALGVISPSVLIIMAIAAFISNFIQYPIVQKAFWGIRLVVCAQILRTIISLWKAAVKDIFGICVYVLVLALALFTSLPTVLLLVLAGAGGIAMAALRQRGKRT